MIRQHTIEYCSQLWIADNALLESWKAAAQKPTRSITDNATLQGLEKTCDEACEQYSMQEHTFRSVDT